MRSAASGQLEGIAMAKRDGVYRGGRARLDRERVRTLADAGVGPAAIARELGIARSSVYRLLGHGKGPTAGERIV